MTMLSNSASTSVKFGTKCKDLSRAKPMALQLRPTDLIEVSKDISWRLKTHKKRDLFLALKLHLSAICKWNRRMSKRSKSWFFIVHSMDALNHLKDVPFLEKYEEEIISLYSIYLILKESTKEMEEVFLTERLKNYLEARKDILFHPRVKSQLEKRFNVDRFLLRVNRLLNRCPRPQRFVGVGYRDQGTCRQDSYDGSPSWQEVASASKTVTKERPVREPFIEDLDLQYCIPELEFHARRLTGRV